MSEEIKTTEQNQTGGVKTPEGKAISRYNAQKHAILRNTITEYEEADAAEVYNDLTDDLQPRGRLQEIIVEAIASNVIRLQRIAKAETELIKETLAPSYADQVYFKEYTARVPVSVAEKLLLYSRYQTSTENRIYRALSVLKQFNLHEQQT